MKQLLCDGYYKCEEAIIIKVDNQSAFKLICNPEYHKRSKHIDIRYHFIREKSDIGDIDIEYAYCRNQLTDISIKSILSRDLFRNLFRNQELVRSVKISGINLNTHQKMRVLRLMYFSFIFRV